MIKTASYLIFFIIGAISALSLSLAGFFYLADALDFSIFLTITASPFTSFASVLIYNKLFEASEGIIKIIFRSERISGKKKRNPKLFKNHLCFLVNP